MNMRPSEEGRAGRATRAIRVGDDVPAPVADTPAVLDDRYEMGAALGHGGTATVYRAHDRKLERTVAIKLFASGAVGPDQRGHEHEVKALSHLNHPGLVKLYDAGSHEGRAYLVMQLVEGQTLADRIGDGDDPLSPETTTALGAVLAGTLGYVHARGVVHRDLKPANVLLDTEGHPMITDFGIARLVDTTRVTATGFMVGTAAYLAPEQVRGEHVGSAADVYALGLVLLECVTGRREYPGGALEAAVARLHRSPAVPDGLPQPLAGLLRGMTADDPVQRPSAASVAATLGGTGTAVMGATDATTTQATRAIAPLAASPDTDPATAPRERTQPEPAAVPVRRRRRLALFTAGGAAAAVVAAVLAVLALAGPREAPVPPPAQPAPAPVSPVDPQLPEQQTEAPADPNTTTEQQPAETTQPEQPGPSGQPQPQLPLPDLGPPPSSEQAPSSTTEPTPSESPESTPPSSPPLTPESDR